MSSCPARLSTGEEQLGGLKLLPVTGDPPQWLQWWCSSSSSLTHSSTSQREAGAGGRPSFLSLIFQNFCEADEECLRPPACCVREIFTFASCGKLPVASPTPLSQSWQLFTLFLLLDIGKCFMWENGKWKYVQRTVTGTVENGIDFHTAQGKIKLKNSSINNVYVCQSSMSNHEELHVSQLSPVLCGSCLGRSNNSPLSQVELKSVSFVSSCATTILPVPWFLVCKAPMQQSLLEYLSWCLTWFCPEHVVPLQIIIQFESDAYLKWAKWLTIHNPGHNKREGIRCTISLCPCCHVTVCQGPLFGRRDWIPCV